VNIEAVRNERIADHQRWTVAGRAMFRVAAVFIIGDKTL